jgi:hypothetical protein
MLVLEHSNDQDHEHGEFERRRIDASEEAIGDGNGLFKWLTRVTWCSTGLKALTGCLPGNWSCHYPQHGFGDVVSIYIYVYPHLQLQGEHGDY